MYERYGKRLLDIILSLAATIILAIPMGLVADTILCWMVFYITTKTVSFLWIKSICCVCAVIYPNNGRRNRRMPSNRKN